MVKRFKSISEGLIPNGTFVCAPAGYNKVFGLHDLKKQTASKLLVWENNSLNYALEICRPLCCLRNFNGMEKLMNLMEMRFNPSRVDGQIIHHGTTRSLLFIIHVSG